MPTCPRDKCTLIRVRKGLSLVCPVCDYKEYIKAKHWLPEVRITIDIPTAFAWATWTLSNVEADGDNKLVLSTGETLGTAISPQMINLTRDSRRYIDCTKVKLVWIHDKQTGQGIKYYASNDGGVGYRIVHKADATFNLPSGKEIRQYKQIKYDDLRIKIVLERSSSGDTSPSVTQLVVKYNKTIV